MCLLLVGDLISAVRLLCSTFDRFQVPLLLWQVSVLFVGTSEVLQCEQFRNTCDFTAAFISVSRYSVCAAVRGVTNLLRFYCGLVLFVSVILKYCSASSFKHSAILLWPCTLCIGNPEVLQCE